MTGNIEATFAIEALRRCALFAKVGDEALAVCARSLRVRRFRKNETIFHQGDPGDSLFIVESGSVKIVLPSPEGEEGAIIATLSRGDFFGELALLDGGARSATAVALDASELLELNQAQLGDGLVLGELSGEQAPQNVPQSPARTSRMRCQWVPAQ